MAQFDGRWWQSFAQVGLLLDCLRCSAGQYLSDPCVWHMATWLQRERMGPTFQNLRLAKRHKHLKNYLHWGTVLGLIFDINHFSMQIFVQASNAHQREQNPTLKSLHLHWIGLKPRFASAFRLADSQMPLIYWGRVWVSSCLFCDCRTCTLHIYIYLSWFSLTDAQTII